jgi:hypothetical protein
MENRGASTLHGALTERLKELGANNGELMEVANKLANVDASHTLGHRIFVRGIVAYDQIGLTSIVDAKHLSELITQLTSVPSLRTISIFPYGIISPEVYHVTTAFGNVVAQREGLV